MRTLCGYKYIVSVISAFHMKCTGDIVTDVEVVKTRQDESHPGLLKSQPRKSSGEMFCTYEFFL